MAKVRITLTRSVIGQKPEKKATVRSLGLKKINSSVEVEANDDKAIKEFDRLGLISSDMIRHLITKIEK